MEIKVWVVNILVAYVLMFFNPIQPVRMKNQNQTNILCETGGPTSEFMVVFCTQTNHYFTVLSYKLWKLIYKQNW